MGIQSIAFYFWDNQTADHLYFTTREIRCLVTALACLPVWLLSQSTVQFQHFNEKHGLSQNYITALFQDSLGFLWVGTEEGLNRYDGIGFRVFRHLPADSNSLSNSYVRSIFAGKDGAIWVGTQYGLNRFDPPKEQFERYLFTGVPEPEACNYIHGGTVDRGGNVWVGTYHGLFRLQPASGDWRHFLPDTTLPDGVTHNAIWSVHEDADGLLWAGSSHGLNLLANDDPLVFEQYFHDPDTPASIGSDRVFSFAQTTDGTVWLATRHGLDRAEKTAAGIEFFHYKNDPADLNSISNDFTWQVVASADDQLFLSTYGGGLNVISFPGGNFDRPKITRHLHDEKRPGSIAHNGGELCPARPFGHRLGGHLGGTGQNRPLEQPLPMVAKRARRPGQPAGKPGTGRPF